MVGAIAGGVGAEASPGSRILSSVQTQRLNQTRISVPCLFSLGIIVSFGNTHANTTNSLRCKILKWGYNEWAIWIPMNHIFSFETTNEPYSCLLRMEMVRIFPDRIRIRSDLEGFYPSVSDSGYSISVINPYLNTKKLYFLWYRYPLQSYLAKTNIIRIRLRIRTKIWKQIRYQQYPSVSNPFTSLPAYNKCWCLIMPQKPCICTLKEPTCPHCWIHDRYICQVIWCARLELFLWFDA